MHLYAPVHVLCITRPVLSGAPNTSCRSLVFESFCGVTSLTGVITDSCYPDNLTFCRLLNAATVRSSALLFFFAHAFARTFSAACTPAASPINFYIHCAVYYTPGVFADLIKFLCALAASKECGANLHIPYTSIKTGPRLLLNQISLKQINVENKLCNKYINVHGRCTRWLSSTFFNCCN